MIQLSTVTICALKLLVFERMNPFGCKHLKKRDGTKKHKGFTMWLPRGLEVDSGPRATAPWPGHDHLTGSLDHFSGGIHFMPAGPSS